MLVEFIFCFMDLPTNHSSEIFQIWTIVTLEGWIVHDPGLAGARDHYLGHLKLTSTCGS